MTGCRIGKVTMKPGIHLLPLPEKGHCHKAVENLAASISADTLAVGFFVLSKNRHLITGCSYEGGFSLVDCNGACESLKTDLYETIWGTDGYK